MTSNRLYIYGLAVICGGLLGGRPLHADQPPAAGTDTGRQLAASFQTDVAPFMNEFCLDCHGAEEPEAALDLSNYHSSDDVIEHFAVWNLVRDRIAAGEMPPKDAGDSPSSEQRQRFLDWTKQLQDDFSRRNDGDPGDVLARRLSAAEFNYTIRDFTGVDIRPAAEFPIDPSNEAGFDNSGESLNMTPSLLNKYIEAARTVASHLVFHPDRLGFAPHPVVTETDRDKFCVRRIVDFYQRQNTNVSDYLFAAWQLDRQQHPVDSPITSATIAELPGGLSSKYLQTVHQLLHSSQHDDGPIRFIRTRFHAIPDEANAARAACQQLADEIRAMRQELTFEFPHLSVRGINQGSQTLVLWRNRQMAHHRMSFNEEKIDRLQRLLDRKSSEDVAETPADATPSSELIAACELFCRVFPDRFYVDRRGREYVDRRREDEFNRESEYRLLSAGFHSMMGYFRDDQPLCELVLDDQQKQHLDELWFDLDFIAEAPLRQHSGFIWFERAEGRFLVDAEFDDFRSADKSSAEEAMIAGLRDAYLAKAERNGADDVALQAMRDHFRLINQSIRAVETTRESARQAHVEMLPQLAERAYRRPLSDQERLETIAFYHQLVEQDGLDHQDAVRDVLVSILMSPHFCYRLQVNRPDQASIATSSPVDPGNEAGIHAVPLDSFELANRLSYFLWSSMPDQPLLDAAARGTLSDHAVLREHVERMLRHPKARGMAVEFVGNWLGFRQFESHNSVDRNRFPQFDDALRQAMFQEPIEFACDIMRHNRSVLDFLYANHTFANATLAEHYGIRQPLQYDETGWARVDDAQQFGRGGILPMSVFLTKNSPGLRTSPVKRGFWVVRQLLGTHIPAPPPDVPELPEDESKLGELSLRQVLAQHREHESCAGCHEKFDSVGLVFEGFGPIGERRDNDLSGKPVDVVAEFPDGTTGQGITGLKHYLRTTRQDEFIDALCRKLLSYGLGRSLILADEPLIGRMKNSLHAQDYRYHALIDSIVTSPQFLRRRIQTNAD